MIEINFLLSVCVLFCCFYIKSEKKICYQCVSRSKKQQWVDFTLTVSLCPNATKYSTLHTYILCVRKRCGVAVLSVRYGERPQSCVTRSHTPTCGAKSGEISVAVILLPSRDPLQDVYVRAYMYMYGTFEP